MNQGSELREYAPGETITVLLTVEHDFRLEADVVARFEREDVTPDSPDTHRFDLVTAWGGTLDNLPPIVQQTDTLNTPPGARSTVTLQAKVGGDQMPGEYRCTRIETRGPAGSTIAFEQVPDLRFRVVEERVARPSVVNAVIG